jgi:hypothetical protein
MHYLDTLEEDGIYNFKQLANLRNNYPNIFYPLYELQIRMISESLGETWWEEHKATVKYNMEKKQQQEMKNIRKQKVDQEKSERQVNDEILKKKMGIKYYLMPWLIPHERKKLARIATIEQELEQQFEQLKSDTMVK